MSANILTETMNSYITQLKNRIEASRSQPNYFTQLRQFKSGEQPQKKEQAPIAKNDPDAELMKDIQESKKSGFTLEDVLNAIDEMKEITTKDHAKAVAKKVYSTS